MSQIIFEDRTNETPEQAANRALLDAAGLLAATAVGMAQGNAGGAIAVLAAALGQIAARAGAPIDRVLEVVRHRHDEAHRAAEALHPLSSSRTGQA